MQIRSWQPWAYSKTGSLPQPSLQVETLQTIRRFRNMPIWRTLSFFASRKQGASPNCVLKGIEFRRHCLLTRLFREILLIKNEIERQIYRPRKYKPCKKRFEILEKRSEDFFEYFEHVYCIDRINLKMLIRILKYFLVFLRAHWVDPDCCCRHCLPSS